MHPLYIYIYLYSCFEVLSWLFRKVASIIPKNSGQLEEAYKGLDIRVFVGVLPQIKRTFKKRKFWFIDQNVGLLPQLKRTFKKRKFWFIARVKIKLI